MSLAEVLCGACPVYRREEVKRLQADAAILMPARMAPQPAQLRCMQLARKMCTRLKAQEECAR